MTLHGPSVGSSGLTVPAARPRSIYPPGYRLLALSPDGTRVAVRLADPATGYADIYVLDLDRRVRRRLTTAPGTETYPLWTRDGASVVFASDSLGAGWGIYRIQADGNGTAERLTALESNTDPIRPSGWSADGATLVFTVAGKGTFTLGPSGEQPLLPSAAQPSDGRWLAVLPDASARGELSVRPFPAVKAGLWQVATDAGVGTTFWRRDGRELFTSTPNGC